MTVISKGAWFRKLEVEKPYHQKETAADKLFTGLEPWTYIYVDIGPCLQRPVNRTGSCGAEHVTRKNTDMYKRSAKYCGPVPVRTERQGQLCSPFCWKQDQTNIGTVSKATCKYVAWCLTPTQPLRLYQGDKRQRWRNFWETRWSAYGLFRAHRYHLELNWKQEASARARADKKVWYLED